MEIPDQPSYSAARQDAEESWRIRLEEAYRRYKTATTLYRALLSRNPDGLAPGLEGPLAAAHHAESEALAEYTQVLKVFTELTLHGRVPGERQGTNGNHVDGHARE